MDEVDVRIAGASPTGALAARRFLGRRGPRAVSAVRSVVYAAVVLFGLGTSAWAAPVEARGTAAQIDAWIARQRDGLRLPGVAVVVVADGQVRYRGGPEKPRRGVR